MVEEIKKEETESELEQAARLVKELRAENETKKALLDREEKLKAVSLLGGKSQAGTFTPEPDPEQVIKDRVNAWLKPTGRHI